MKQVFLHIGLHKTGSTTLQVFSHKNRDSLASCGYLYPQVGIPNNLYGHHNLAWSLYQNGRAKPEFGDWLQLRQAIEDQFLDNIIISSEDFETKHPKIIEAINNKLNGYQVKIIVYLRRQDKRIESQYTQLTKSGLYVGDINDFIELVIKQYDYFKFLEPWKQVFGKENIRVRPLEKQQIKDICSDFCQSIGINNLEKFKTINSKNQKPGLKTLAITRYLATLYHRVEINHSKLLPNDPILQHKYLYPIVNFTAKNWQECLNYRLIPYQKSVEILKRFEESNAKVAEEYLGRGDQLLFYEQLKPYNTSSCDLDQLDPKEILSLFLALKH